MSSRKSRRLLGGALTVGLIAAWSQAGHDFASARPSERHPGRATVCGHRGVSSVQAQLVLAKQVLPGQRPRCTTPRERCALAPLW